MHAPSVLLAAGLIATAFTHPGPHHDLSTGEKIRRAGISGRCEQHAAAMNKKRWEAGAQRRAIHKRDALTRNGTVTVEVTTEAPYFDYLKNDTCVLTPEVTTGPYIWPRSQLLRQDMTEDQLGVPLYLDIGVLDVNTCSPMENVLVDIWHCNSTGSYSSFEGLSPNIPFETLLAEMNITFPPPAGTTLDLHTGNTTWLRGMWPTDAEGVMEMKTVFPGFYIQRAIHIHAQVHTNWTIGPNGTVTADNTVSTGQLFFEENLQEQIMALWPYSLHTQINRTTNDIDSVWADEATVGFSPLMQVVPLDGEDVTKGMVGYITLGVDSTATGN